ncbi:MAG: hypothetical protein ACRDY6_10855 [Acidimicrobiia bacterium]
MHARESTKLGRLKALYYWVALFVVLVLADDATFGWVFWLLSQVNPWLSAAAAVAIYWSIGYWIALEGLRPYPRPVAAWFLKRLQLERRNPELAKRELTLKQKITSVAAAVPMTLLLGGVVTALYLRRREVVDDGRARRIAFWLTGLYALEFAVIHALGIGGSIFWARS